MNQRGRVLGVIAVASCVVLPVRAHHAFAPVYDGSVTMSKEGTLQEIRLVNPHAMMTLATTDRDGKPIVWNVETAGRLNLVAARARRLSDPSTEPTPPERSSP